MIIDWYTIVFQAINFLILVFLLRHFLYGPITQAMEERERKIAQREEAATSAKAEAEKAQLAYHQKTEDLGETAEEIMRSARISAEEEKRELLEEARRQVDNTRRRWEEALETEKDAFTDRLLRRIGRQACSIARRCLTDLADARLEELAWEVFLRELGSLTEKERSELKGALASEHHSLSLRSAFAVPRERVRELEAHLQELLDLQNSLKISSKTDPTLVCGLELEVGGYRVAWSVDSYLDGVEERILREIRQTPTSETSKEASGSD